MKYSVISFIVSFILVVCASDPIKAEHYKVVCYFTDWSNYRKGNGKFLPEDIDPDLCTHIVYAFTALDPDSLTIKVRDPRADIDNQFYKRITDFRQKGVKVTVSIGGWSESDGTKYGRLLSDENARSKFITNAIEFIEEHNFQGLDLDLEYPVCWHGACANGTLTEKADYAQFVQELSQAFKPRGWLLSAAVAVNKKVIDAAYDVPKLAQYLDWIALMAYNFHGQWDHKTGQNAPLFSYPGNSNYFYADYAVKYWLQQGAPSTKLVLGAPFYGKTYTLENAANHGLNAPTTGPGPAGESTRSAGILAYYEICGKIKEKGWTIVSNSSIGSYAYLDDQWITFDDVETMRFKAKYVRDSKLGGAMIWSLDLDDFKSTCNQGKFPLLSALNQGLRH